MAHTNAKLSVLTQQKHPHAGVRCTRQQRCSTRQHYALMKKTTSPALDSNQHRGCPAASGDVVDVCDRLRMFWHSNDCMQTAQTVTHTRRQRQHRTQHVVCVRSALRVAASHLVPNLGRANEMVYRCLCANGVKVDVEGVVPHKRGVALAETARGIDIPAAPRHARARVHELLRDPGTPRLLRHTVGSPSQSHTRALRGNSCDVIPWSGYWTRPGSWCAVPYV
jgi:hypothetical protein